MARFPDERQAVGPVFAGNAAQGPQGILKVLGQRSETFAAQHHRRMFPATVGQNEVEEPVF